MKIAITISTKEDGSVGLDNSRVQQMPIFLQRLLRANGHDSYLVYGQCKPTHSLNSVGIEDDEVVERLDNAKLVLELARSLTYKEYEFYKAQDAKIVGLCYDPIVFDTMASAVGQLSIPYVNFSSHKYDEFWLSELLWDTHFSWLSTVYKVKVRKVPHIWEPLFVVPRVEIQRVSGKYSVGICESNSSVISTAEVPLMIVAKAREYTMMMDQLSVFNADRLDVPSFMAYLTRLGFYSELDKFTIKLFSDCDPLHVAHQCDLLVFHAWENCNRYQLYEALYGGYMVVHNAPEVSKFGYYYPSFSVTAGAHQVAKALANPISSEQLSRSFGDYLSSREPYKELEILL
jgi:hypothetical protein